MLIKCRSSINRGVDQRYRGSMENQMRLLIGVLIEGRWRVDQGYQLKAAIDTAELCNNSTYDTDCFRHVYFK